MSFSSSGGKFESALLHVRDEKSNNTVGGSFTNGAWQTRTLNTVMTNEISGASLSSNQIILPSGTYYIEAFAPNGYGGAHKVKLRNITDSSDTLIGTNMYQESAQEVHFSTSFVVGRFTIAAQKTFELQHRCGVTYSSGFGIASNFSVVEVYSNAMIWKVA